MPLSTFPAPLAEQIAHSLLETAPATLPYVFVSVQGPDAQQALQGQLSCDLLELEQGVVSFGTANSPKGRMYALFRITPWKDGYLLCLNRSVLEHFKSQIGKYLNFFKCELKDEPEISSQLVRTTSLDLDGGDILVSQLQLQGTDSTLCELWSSRESTPPCAEALWASYQCSIGVPELYPETLDHFILQQLNLQDFGAVSFKKGCYTGQEIIARMKYLGKLKKRAFTLSGDKVEEALPKAPLLDADGKKVGELVRASHLGDHTIALGVLDISYTEHHNQVHIDTSGERTLSIHAT